LKNLEKEEKREMEKKKKWRIYEELVNYGVIVNVVTDAWGTN
jgi:hypothetical protein